MNSQNTKTFSPIVLFNHHNQQPLKTHNNDTPSNEDQHTQSLIEQHRLKTREMLAQNAQLWERESYTHSEESKSTSIAASDQCHTSSNSDLFTEKFDQSSKICYNFRTLFTPTPSTSIATNSSNHRSTAVPFSTNHLYDSVVMTTATAPTSSTPTTTNLPQQRAPHTSYVNTISRSESMNDRTIIDEAPEQEHPLMTTTFITEPQFHPTYRPNISRKRRRGNLPKEVTEYLKRWLILHKKHPYPTEREKQKLADETGLMVSQISNWFINARRRILQPLLESEQQDAATNNTNPDTTTDTTTTNVVPDRSRTSSTTDVLFADAAVTPEPTSSTYHHKYIIGGLSSADGRSRQHSIDDTISLNDDDEESQYQQEPNESSTNLVSEPSWTRSPGKLASMHVLDQDIDVFQPE
ncbi:hypothetical protein BD408DRAFT_416202 [Parasitella parasitica]|nr:hypothetical protein BD408DRAFT_416202 [Parasitella parasitica]